MIMKDEDDYFYDFVCWEAGFDTFFMYDLHVFCVSWFLYHLKIEKFHIKHFRFLNYKQYLILFLNGDRAKI